MCAIVCISLHLSLINFSLRHGSPEKFLANTKKTKNKLTFFNWMLRNEWKDKNHLGKKRLSYSNKTIVWNVEKKRTEKLLHFVQCVKRLFISSMVFSWYGIYSQTMEPPGNSFRLCAQTIATKCSTPTADMPYWTFFHSLSLSLCVTISLWSEIQWITIRFGIDNRHHRHGI